MAGSIFNTKKKFFSLKNSNNLMILKIPFLFINYEVRVLVQLEMLSII